MMADTHAVAEAPLDALLAPYEARPPTVSEDERLERRRALALGDVFNRIQGVECHPAIERLGRLWCTGRIDRREYVEIVGRMGRARLLRSQEKP